MKLLVVMFAALALAGCEITAKAEQAPPKQPVVVHEPAATVSAPKFEPNEFYKKLYRAYDSAQQERVKSLLENSFTIDKHPALFVYSSAPAKFKKSLLIYRVGENKPLVTYPMNSDAGWYYFDTPGQYWWEISPRGFAWAMELYGVGGFQEKIFSEMVPPEWPRGHAEKLAIEQATARREMDRKPDVDPYRFHPRDDQMVPISSSETVINRDGSRTTTTKDENGHIVSVETTPAPTPRPNRRR